MSERPVKVASVYTSFHIHRNPHEAHEGPVTLEEQAKAAARFVRWHERQVAVGRQLLSQIERQLQAAAPQLDQRTAALVPDEATAAPIEEVK